MKLENNLLISSEQDVRSSSVYTGFLILKLLNKKHSITIFDLYSTIRKQLGGLNFRTMLYAVTFLFMNDLILFKSPHILKKK
ncbi:MAG: hypothetical protein LiPW15_330 [Parcubacteria group bacterium LiPW_15]|nr:MAG: hypothetical protein LiPW15_330 [Parcubacteria group bacterium LiPW_15]